MPVTSPGSKLARLMTALTDAQDPVGGVVCQMVYRVG